MKKIKQLMTWILVVVMIANVGILAAAKSKSDSTQKAAGWIKKQDNTYYRDENGKLVKNIETMIDGNLYCFDQKGRLVKGVYKDSENGCTRYYSKKDGRYRYSVIKLKITEAKKGSVIGKHGKSKYCLTGNVKVYDQNGKKISLSKLKKGETIKVRYDGNILESYPAQFVKIYKVNLL